MPESLQDAISTAIDETEDKRNETATQISDLQPEVYVLEGTIDSCDHLPLNRYGTSLGDVYRGTPANFGVKGSLSSASGFA